MTILEITLPELKDLLSDLSDLATPRWIDTVLRDALPDLEQAAATRYLDVSRTTEYSTTYVGELKPSGQVRAGDGGDPGYAIDTLQLFSDLTSPEVSRGSVVFGSDLD